MVASWVLTAGSLVRHTVELGRALEHQLSDEVVAVELLEQLLKNLRTSKLVNSCCQKTVGDYTG